jgi:nucleotide-binding universal stress UspA family protein
MYKHILLPVDGSDLSLRAADAGIALARQLGARVHALHVVVPLVAVPFLNEVIATSDAEYTGGAEEAGARYLAAVRERAEAAGVPCRCSLETDPRPHHAIAAVARREGCDLIVMGSHGWRGLNRLLLGSETQRVVLEAEVPVLVNR